ncbi:MAG TPA: right-handed parallel beta-helix repeat-containing protein [Nitrososphaeraceae archaeon]|nr:right-handed parallel beta-helix repeat-containing protein [Nitrososphaeraceae archaeon]
MFSYRNIIILGIVGFPSLILLLVSTIDTSFAVDIQSTSSSNAEFENEVIKNNNSPKEDENICLRYENITKTIVVCNGTVDLLTINDFFNNNSDILEMIGEKEWILKSNILILENGTLNINGINARSLKIDSDSSNNIAYSIISRGNLIIDNTNITSWNSTSNEIPQLNNPETPRAYIWTFWNSAGKTNITNSIFENLGYKGHSGTTGITFFSGDGSVIQNNTIISNYFGLHFANEVSNITIKNNNILKNQFDGINLDSNTNNIDIVGNRIYENNLHAIVCKKSCNNIKIMNNILENNIGIGILFERNSSMNYVESNTIRSNTMGMMVSESLENDIISNSFVANGNGIFLKNTKNNIITSNNITNSNNYGLNIYNNSTNNLIQFNNIKKSMNSGINIADYGTNYNKLENNKIAEGSNYGLKFDKTSKNILENNLIENNQNDDIFIRQSKNNKIVNSYFNYTEFLLNDKKSNMIITDTMNKIIDGNNITNTVYKQNNTIILNPNNNFTKLKTTDLTVNPESSYVNITKVNYDLEKDKEYKRIDLVYPELGITTNFVLGGFNPGSQVLVKVNKEIKDLITIDNNKNMTEFNLINDQLSYRLEFELTTTPVLITIIILFILILISISIFLILRKKRRNREINKQQTKI